MLGGILGFKHLQQTIRRDLLHYGNEALNFVMTSRQASISGIQRALRVGYNRAARIIDLMEKNGVVGPPDGAKPRKVLGNGRHE